MPSTSERLSAMAKEHFNLTQPVDMTSGLAAGGVSSMAAVAFLRAVIQETGVEITPEQFAAIPNLQALAEHIDANSG